MKYLSVCDGIGAAHIWEEELGWRCVGASEIAEFPKAVVHHNKPHIPSLGDMTKYHEWNIEHPDLICGGTPCQSFSVAGLRAGLADPRGNLALVFLGIVDHFRPTWVVWENVPGVYSAVSHEPEDDFPPDDPVEVERDGQEVDKADEYFTEEQHAFACFLAGLQELGYGVYYRTLDAQYFGVPQRRRRPFVVAYLGDWRPPTAVLLEPESMSGNPPPSRASGQRPTGTLAARSGGGGGLGTDLDLDGGLVQAAIPDVSSPLTVGASRSGGGQVPGTSVDGAGGLLIPETVGALTDGAHNGGGLNGQDAYTGRILPVVMAHGQGNAEIVSDGSPSLTCNHEAPILAHAFKMRGGGEGTGERGGPVGTKGGVGYLGQDECAFTISTHEDQMLAVPQPIALQTDVTPKAGSIAFTLKLPSESGGGQPQAVMDQTYAVRRLTPRECERLQAFPDDYTMIPWRGKPADQCPDGPRYKALGNSWCRNVALWIGRRIQMVQQIKAEGLPSSK